MRKIYDSREENSIDDAIYKPLLKKESLLYLDFRIALGKYSIS